MGVIIIYIYIQKYFFARHFYKQKKQIINPFYRVYIFIPNTDNYIFLLPILLLPLLLLLLLDRPPYPNGMIIVGWWSSSPRKEAKVTL